MWDTRTLVDTLDAQHYLLFYKLMNYPVPKTMEPFLEGKKNWTKPPASFHTNHQPSFSRSHKNPLMDDYIAEIEKYATLYKSLPFVEEIYLCNSITFNALHQDSDIDLFIIARPWRIRTAKFRAMLFFTFAGIKRSLKNKRKKVCLSFFITANHQNLYALSLPQLDIYLSYWIQHLVLLYQEHEKKKSEIFKKNKRVQGILPNYPGEQCIFLGNRVFSWTTRFKRVTQRLGRGVLGDIGEILVKYAQLFVIRLKILRDPERNKDVITNDQMLKFHKDIREKISLKYSIAIKK